MKTDLLANLEKGDCLRIKKVSEVASNLKEYIGFMRVLFELGIDLAIEDEDIDTRTAFGKLLITILVGLDAFDDRYFNSEDSG